MEVVVEQCKVEPDKPKYIVRSRKEYVLSVVVKKDKREDSWSSEKIQSVIQQHNTHTGVDGVGA